jgi:SAM-dependent methyltransferase
MRTRATTNFSGAGLDDSDLYADEHHWGSTSIDVAARDLPALKASYLVANLPDAGKVLEIGCGGGRILNTVAAHKPALQLFGCDIRPLKSSSGNFDFQLVRPDDNDLPYAPETFDMVIMCDFLEHVRLPAQVLSAARRLIKPGGGLIGVTPLEGQRVSFYTLYRKILGDDLYVRTKEHIQTYSKRSIRALVEREFEIVDTAFAYHPVGQFMDATLFAMLRSPRLARRFWSDNPFYEEAGAPARGGRASLLGVALRGANAVAYWESSVLHATGIGATGFLFVARPKVRS